MKATLKIYDRNFKEKAVQLSYEMSNISQLEKELEISPSLLSKWRKEYEKFGKLSFLGIRNLGLSAEEVKIRELEKNNQQLELKFEILKKADRSNFQGLSELYQFIENNKKIYSINIIFKVLGIGVDSYYRWKKKTFTERQLRITSIKEKINSLFFEFKQRYGSYRIARELQSQGYPISGSQVAYYMKQMGLCSVKKKRYQVTTNSNHSHYIFPNVLNREFAVKEPCKVWVSGIKFIQTIKGRLYLTIILDLFDRKIIGWSLSKGLTTRETSLAAWEMAIKNRKITNELLFHSDRGVQYANKNFTNILDSKNVKRSMSCVGNCFDNAVAESFFRSLKSELIYRNNLLTEKKMKEEIYKFIENGYNKTKKHSPFEYKTIEIKPKGTWSWKFDIVEIDKILNDMGSQGWELVTTESRDMSGTAYGFHYTFKREI